MQAGSNAPYFWENQTQSEIRRGTHASRSLPVLKCTFIRPMMASFRLISLVKSSPLGQNHHVWGLLAWSSSSWAGASWSWLMCCRCGYPLALQGPARVNRGGDGAILREVTHTVTPQVGTSPAAQAPAVAPHQTVQSKPSTGSVANPPHNSPPSSAWLLREPPEGFLSAGHKH